MTEHCHSHRPDEYAGHVNRVRAADPLLAAELDSFTCLEHVLEWMQQNDLGRAAVDLVPQDEFSSDFLVELEPAGRWLVFGVT